MSAGIASQEVTRGLNIKGRLFLIETDKKKRGMQGTVRELSEIEKVTFGNVNELTEYISNRLG